MIFALVVGLQWLDSSKVEVVEFEGYGFGVRALVDLEDECIMRVPSSVCSRAWSWQSPRQQLARKLGKGLANEALPARWSDAELEALRTPEVAQRARQRRERREELGLSSALDEVSTRAFAIDIGRERPIAAALCGLAGCLNHVFFVLALLLLVVRPTCVALVPGADLLNHANGANTRVRYDALRDHVAVVATAQKGHQVFLDYGPLANADLLLDFGFVLPDNIHDSRWLRRDDNTSVLLRRTTTDVSLVDAALADLAMLRGPEDSSSLRGSLATQFRREQIRLLDEYVSKSR